MIADVGTKGLSTFDRMTFDPSRVGWSDLEVRLKAALFEPDPSPRSKRDIMNRRFGHSLILARWVQALRELFAGDEDGG